MAEEEDGRIRVLQSLRGKICKCGFYVFFPLVVFFSGHGGAGEGGRLSHRRRAAGGARRSVEAEADPHRSSAPVPT